MAAWTSTITPPRKSGFYPVRAPEFGADFAPIMAYYSYENNQWTAQNTTDYYKWAVENGKFTEWFDWTVQQIVDSIK